ncbi:MAG TPA: sodium:alanine symporter family protein [Firmicutes bacterium]|nr:sodium:alanine symporter family protein [Bacillota bacterium]
MDVTAVLDLVNNFVWGPPLLILLVGTGILFTIRLRGIQLNKLPLAFKLIFKAEDSGDGEISSFAALCTALAATVGTGNIIGVATAIAAGGPGALFWMWLAAFFGMATKYAEGVLAIKYREIDEYGEYSGGPMYYILNGLGEKFKPLAKFFAMSAILVALFGIGTFTQVNAITSITKSTFGMSEKFVSILLAALVAIIIFGGIKNISKVAEKVVPIMASAYILICLFIIATNASLIPSVFATIFKSAFTPTAAFGGFVGATMSMAIRNGIARGVFSNESGLGSAPIAAAAAKCNYSAEQGLISMTGTFIDSMIICSLTGISLLITGTWCQESLSGVGITEAAFNSVLPTVGGMQLGSILLMLCLSLFAFTTILGWSYYGERCWEFLFGVKGINGYRMFFVLMVGLGGFLQLDAVWLLADIVNGLMALPNLIALVALSGVVVEETKVYFDYLETKQQAVINSFKKVGSQ